MIECDTLSTRTVTSISVTGGDFSDKMGHEHSVHDLLERSGRAGAGGGGRGPG